MAQTVKHLSTMQETWVRSLGWEDPLEKERQSTPGLLPGKSHRQRSLVGYSPWGRKESDTTERLHFIRLLIGLILILLCLRLEGGPKTKEKIICDPGKRATRISDLAYMSFSL